LFFGSRLEYGSYLICLIPSKFFTQLSDTPTPYLKNAFAPDYKYWSIVQTGVINKAQGGLAIAEWFYNIKSGITKGKPAQFLFIQDTSHFSNTQGKLLQFPKGKRSAV
jgi:hypothetical protein